MLSNRSVGLGVAFVLVAFAAFVLGSLSARSGHDGAPAPSAARPAPEIRLDPASVDLLPDAHLELRLRPDLDASIGAGPASATPRGSASARRP